MAQGRREGKQTLEKMIRSKKISYYFILENRPGIPGPKGPDGARGMVRPAGPPGLAGEQGEQGKY